MPLAESLLKGKEAQLQQMRQDSRSAEIDARIASLDSKRNELSAVYEYFALYYGSLTLLQDGRAVGCPGPFE